MIQWYWASMMISRLVYVVQLLANYVVKDRALDAISIGQPFSVVHAQLSLCLYVVNLG